MKKEQLLLDLEMIQTSLINFDLDVKSIDNDEENLQAVVTRIMKKLANTMTMVKFCRDLYTVKFSDVDGYEKRNKDVLAYCLRILDEIERFYRVISEDDLYSKDIRDNARLNQIQTGKVIERVIEMSKVKYDYSDFFSLPF